MLDIGEPKSAQNRKDGIVAGLLGAYPDQPVEHTAFEVLHHDDKPHGGMSVLREFLDDYVLGYHDAPYTRSIDVVGKLISTILEHAVGLAADGPDNIEEIDRRVNMWLDALIDYSTMYGHNDLAMQEVLTIAGEDWTRSYGELNNPTVTDDELVAPVAS